MNRFYTLLFAFFSLSSFAQPANDLCSGAELMLPGEECSPFIGDASDATFSDDANFTCSGEPDDDVWFKFIASSPTHIIQFGGTGSYDAALEVFQGICGSLVLISCVDNGGEGETEEVTLTDLNIGTLYYYRGFDVADNVAGDVLVYSTCVIQEPIPVNPPFDTPCEAFVEPLDVDAAIVHFYSNADAGVDPGESEITPDVVADCYGLDGWCNGNTLSNTLWLSFIAPASGEVFIDLCNSGLGTDFNTQIALYSFTLCAAYTSFNLEYANDDVEDCDGASYLSACDLNDGEQYLILINGAFSQSGTFGIRIGESSQTSGDLDAFPTVCSDVISYDMKDDIPNADDGGQWLDLDLTGANIGSLLNASLLESGQSYTFAYVLSGGGCYSTDTTFVEVSIPLLPNAGEGQNVLFCETSPSDTLFNFLLNDPDSGGVWTDPLDAVFDGIIDPSADISGIYTYSLSSPDCPGLEVISELEITITTIPDPGEDAVLNICSNSEPVNLTDQLGGTPDPGGSWLDPNNEIINEVVDPEDLIDGDYFYIFSQAGCGFSQSVLTINLDQIPSAGETNTLILCELDPEFMMIDSLNGDPAAGGIWYDADSNPIGDSFDPSQDSTGVYLYIQSGNIDCGQDIALLIITVYEAPFAGTSTVDNEICLEEGSYPYIDLLLDEPDLDGQWLNPAGEEIGPFYNPLDMEEGIYTFVVEGEGSCENDSASVEVILTSPSNPGTTNAIVVFDVTAIDLADSIGVYDEGGVWIDIDNSGGLVGSVFTPDPSMTPNSYEFIYEITNEACGDTSVSVFVLVDIIGGLNINALASVKLYPNPASDRIYLSSMPNQPYRYSIYDLSGRTIRNNEEGVDSFIDINALEKGFYTLILNNKQTFTFIKH